MLAGIPVLANLPFKSMPGVTTVDLIGSSILKPAAILPNPCQLTPALALGDSPLMIQSSARPMPSSTSLSGPHTLNHQSAPYSSSTLRMARRKSSASAILSSTSAVPPGGSIMAAATSQLAMMLYCGLVLVKLDGLRILHQHLAGLADAGQQFVNRLGDIHHGVLRPYPVLAHGMVGTIKRVKRGMRQPGFLKVNVLHIAVKHGLHRFGVVEHTVVGGLGQCHHTRLDLAEIHVGKVTSNQGVGLDFCLDGSRFELALGDRTNDAKVVARGLQKYRNRPGHDDRVQDGHVAIAVHHHHVVGRHRVVPHHLVAGAGAVGDKKAVVRIENPCCIAFTLANGTVMVQQLTELFHGVAD